MWTVNEVYFVPGLAIFKEKPYVILMGGHEKCLLLMTRGGGVKKFPKPAYVIHGCSLKETIDLKVTRAHSQLEHYFFSYLLTWEVDHWNSRDYASNVAMCHFLKPETNKGDLFWISSKKL